jgi:hypothetical protein
MVQTGVAPYRRSGKSALFSQIGCATGWVAQFNGPRLYPMIDLSSLQEMKRV